MRLLGVASKDIHRRTFPSGPVKGKMATGPSVRPFTRVVSPISQRGPIALFAKQDEDSSTRSPRPAPQPEHFGSPLKGRGFT